MTPLTKIENGILSGDWQLVCDGFNKITGKSLTPPVTTNRVATFDAATASKKELYTYIKTNLNQFIAPMKAFTIDELREMIVIFSAEGLVEIPAIEETKPTKKTSRIKIDPNQTGFLPDGRFFQPSHLYGNKTMIEVDRTPLRLIEDPNLKKVIEPDDFEHNPRDAPKMADIVCLKCKKKFTTLERLGVFDDKDNETKGICPTCQESVGRQ